MRGIRKGDREAFTALFNATYRSLCDFAWKFVGSPAVAEELVQDVFLKIWEGRREWSPAGSARAYLFKAVRNRALNHVRDRKSRREKEARLERPAPSTLEEELQFKELALHVKWAIEALPERRRLIFTLHRFHGLTYAEVAAALDISTNTVDTQMRRVLKLLREHLAAYRE